MNLASAQMGEPMLALEDLRGIPSEELVGMLPALPPELAEAAGQLIDEREAARVAKLKDLCKRLEEKRDRSVVAKRPIEQRWAEDKRQLLGLRRSLGVDRRNLNPNEQPLLPGLNLTASRSLIWSARVTNMMAPGASGQPWTISPTPSPEIYDDAGSPLPPEQAKLAADAAANGMREEIKDQWAECHVPREVRLAASDLVELGTGIISGPNNYRKRKRKFKKIQAGGRTVMDVQVDARVRPAWPRVDPRYFFPEMVDSIEKARYAFEIVPMTSAEVKDLSQTEGFERFRDEFAELLDKKPDLGAWSVNLIAWNELAPFEDAVDDRYAVWKFVGFLDRKDSELLGCECIDLSGSSEDPDAREIDRAEQMVEIWFCDGHILKADPYVLDGSDRLPWYVVPFFRIDDTMFGGSLAWRARDAQDSIHALYAALQHNVSVSAGSITAFLDGKVEPGGGNWDQAVGGPMLVRITDSEVTDIRQVFSTYIIPNNAEQIMAVLKFRIESFDEEINLPLIAQGQPSEAVPTSSGLAMLMNAANIAQKDIAQACEDGWLVPMLESAYAWNMLHNPREDIKGDFDCVASLVSDNVFKDLRAQRLLMLHNMRATDPELQIRVNEDVLYPQIAQAMEVDGALFRTNDEVKAAKEEQAKNQPQDPAIQELALKQAKFEADTEFQKVDRDLDHQERMEELRIRDEESQARRFVAQMNVKIEEMRLQDDVESKVQDRHMKVLMAASKEQHDDKKLGATVGVEAEKLAHAERAVDKEIFAERNRVPGPIV